MEGRVATGDTYVRETPRHHWSGEPYRSPRRIAAIVIALLVANVVWDSIATVTDFQLLGLIDRAAQGELVDPVEADRLDSQMRSIATLQMLAALAGGIAFIVWIRRLYRNLPALGVKWLRFKQGWAVGGWFVPFLNVARPKSIANDIWRATNPGLPREIEGPAPGAPVPALLNWWWAAFLMNGWFYRIGDSPRGDASLERLRTAMQIYAGMDAISVVAGVLAIFVVRRMTDRQEARRAALEGLGPLA